MNTCLRTDTTLSKSSGVKVHGIKHLMRCSLSLWDQLVVCSGFSSFYHSMERWAVMGTQGLSWPQMCTVPLESSTSLKAQSSFNILEKWRSAVGFWALCQSPSSSTFLPFFSFCLFSFQILSDLRQHSIHLFCADVWEYWKGSPLHEARHTLCKLHCDCPEQGPLTLTQPKMHPTGALATPQRVRSSLLQPRPLLHDWAWHPGRTASLKEPSVHLFSIFRPRGEDLGASSLSGKWSQEALWGGRNVGEEGGETKVHWRAGDRRDSGAIPPGPSERSEELALELSHQGRWAVQLPFLWSRVTPRSEDGLWQRD